MLQKMGWKKERVLVRGAVDITYRKKKEFGFGLDEDIEGTKP